MRVGSLFSGIGGLDLGLERAGMRVSWQVEIDHWCRRVLAKHWPNVTRHEDVRNVGTDNLEPVDLVCGGFPCQPFSLAGQRRGEGDDRNLWPEMRRIVDELRPRWVVAENVPGIIGLYLDTVLSDLEALGYTCGAVVLPACAFDAPHIRQRLFVIAHAASQRRGARRAESAGQQRPAGTDNGGSVLADAECEGLALRFGGETAGRPCVQPAGGSLQPLHGQTLADAARKLSHGDRGARGGRSEPTDGGWWSVEPPVGRVVDGLPGRVDRLRGLGNAVVPQVALHIGRLIMAVEGQA